MTEVSSAAAAEDFGSHPVSVGLADDRLGNLVVKTRPSTVTLELVVGAVQRRMALAADEGARVLQVGVFPRERRFGALAKNHVLFVGGQFIQGK